MSDTSTGPALSVTGITQAHAKRAIKWMRDRNMLAFYNAKDGSLNAFEFRGGPEWTYRAMNDAIKATRR